MSASAINSYEDLDKVIAKAFPDADIRSQAIALLGKYGTEDFHREIPRVRAAIIKVAHADIEKLQGFVDIACSDYRDLLVMAEYEQQSRNYSLKKNDPQKDQRLVEKDEREYSDWVKKMTE